MGSEKNKDDKIAKFINYIHLRCIRLHCDEMYTVSCILASCVALIRHIHVFLSPHCLEEEEGGGGGGGALVRTLILPYIKQETDMVLTSGTEFLSAGSSSDGTSSYS